MSMNMWGNDDTGEVLEIGWDPNVLIYPPRQGAYIVVQHRGPDNKPAHKGYLFTSSNAPAMSQWFQEHKAKSKGKFYKLRRHVLPDAPIVQQMEPDKPVDTLLPETPLPT